MSQRAWIVGLMLAKHVDLREARRDRDKWIRAFNRLEAAVTHHKRDKGDLFSDEADESLWVARDKILKSLAPDRP